MNAVTKIKLRNLKEKIKRNLELAIKFENNKALCEKFLDQAAECEKELTSIKG